MPPISQTDQHQRSIFKNQHMVQSVFQSQNKTKEFNLKNREGSKITCKIAHQRTPVFPGNTTTHRMVTHHRTIYIHLHPRTRWRVPNNHNDLFVMATVQRNHESIQKSGIRRQTVTCRSVTGQSNRCCEFYLNPTKSHLGSCKGTETQDIIQISCKVLTMEAIKMSAT